jgi:hypothetical protein
MLYVATNLAKPRNSAQLFCMYRMMNAGLTVSIGARSTASGKVSEVPISVTMVQRTFP